MSAHDEYRQSDRPWSGQYIESLIRRVNFGTDPINGEEWYEDGDGWYGMKCRAYDSGNPELLLDAIQLEQAVDSIQDMAVKVATILAMHGFDERDIGALIRDPRHRPGVRLVDDGIRIVRRFERDKRD